MNLIDNEEFEARFLQLKDDEIEEITATLFLITSLLV